MKKSAAKKPVPAKTASCCKCAKLAARLDKAETDIKALTDRVEEMERQISVPTFADGTERAVESAPLIDPPGPEWGA